MNSFQKLIGVSLIIVSLSVAYYFVIYLPKFNEVKLKNEETKIRQEEKIKEQERNQKVADKLLLNNCLSIADIQASNFWDKECVGLGRQKDCSLPQSVGNRVDDYNKGLKDECFKKYPQN